MIFLYAIIFLFFTSIPPHPSLQPRATTLIKLFVYPHTHGISTFVRHLQEYHKTFVLLENYRVAFHYAFIFPFFTSPTETTRAITFELIPYPQTHVPDSYVYYETFKYGAKIPKSPSFMSSFSDSSPLPLKLQEPSP